MFTMKFVVLLVYSDLILAWLSSDAGVLSVSAFLLSILAYCGFLLTKAWREHCPFNELGLRFSPEDQPRKGRNGTHYDHDLPRAA